jgi:hypothetical protein
MGSQTRAEGAATLEREPLPWLAMPTWWTAHAAGKPAGGGVTLLFTSRMPSHHANVPLSCDGGE